MLRLNDFPVLLHAGFPNTALIWRNDYRIWQTCRQNSLISSAQHEKWLEKISIDPSIKMFGIFQVKECLCVGVCGLTSIDQVNQKAEFSLYIESTAQGRGYAKAALTTLLWHGFNNLNLNRIWGEVFETNEVALNMFIKMGFKGEGTLEETYFRDGKYIDSFIISILRKAFNDNHPELSLHHTNCDTGVINKASNACSDSGENDPTSKAPAGRGRENEEEKA